MVGYIRRTPRGEFLFLPEEQVQHHDNMKEKLFSYLHDSMYSKFYMMYDNIYREYIVDIENIKLKMEN